MQPPPHLIRVLVVADSVVARRIIARALERDPAIARTDFAANGVVALAKLARQCPDVVVLDLETPDLGGFGTLTEIRRSHPALPVVLFTSMEERVAAATLDSLSLGPTHFVLKPTVGTVDQAEAHVTATVTPLVKALAAAGPARRPERRPDQPQSFPEHPVTAVVVAVSTGGPDVLAALVRALPRDLPVPVLVVQHMPPMFTRLLAERLDRLGGPTVAEAQDGDLVRPAQVLIAPGGRHLTVVRRASEVHVSLDDGPPENSCRPAADVLFRSAVTAWGAGVLAVVLTGMGHDGLRGAQIVRAAHGQVVVQDPATAVVGSMPAAVSDAGLAQAVLTIEELAPAVVQRVTGKATP